jgi:hypothetical protein
VYIVTPFGLAVNKSKKDPPQPTGLAFLVDELQKWQYNIVITRTKAHRFEQLVWGWTAGVRERFSLQTKVLPKLANTLVWFRQKNATSYPQVTHSLSTMNQRLWITLWITKVLIIIWILV